VGPAHHDLVRGHRDGLQPRGAEAVDRRARHRRRQAGADVLDTGATRTVITPRVLEAVGVSYRDALRGSLRGVTGEAEVLAVKVESIDVSGAAYGPLVVVSHDTGFARGDGLLGRDFLDHFTVNIDNAAGVVTLTPK